MIYMPIVAYFCSSSYFKLIVRKVVSKRKIIQHKNLQNQKTNEY